MCDFDSNPFADPDFSNPFQVANGANNSANNVMLHMGFMVLQ